MPESPAFHVLLERLQQKAQELEESSRTLAAPGELSQAVDIARASLEDANTLSDRLLEAFREAQLNTGADAETPIDPDRTSDTPREHR